MDMMPRFENKGGMPGPNFQFQGGAWGPWAWPQGRQGFGRRDGMRRPGPMAENWRRGPWQGRGGGAPTPQGRMSPGDERPGWRQDGAWGGPGPDAVTPPAPRSGEDESNSWAPPRWERWGPGRGWGIRPGGRPNIEAPAGPEVTAPPKRPADQPAKTPEADAPGLAPGAPEEPQQKE